MADKKAKNIERMKELETKFTKLCEDRMKQIHDELKASSEKELSSKIAEKDKEIESLKDLIENSYILIKEHEQIVNDKLIKLKKTNALEIERLCDQFEKELVQAQEEHDLEKEAIQSQLKQQIISLQEKHKNNSEQYNSVQNNYSKLEKDLNTKVNNTKRLEDEKTELIEKLNKLEISKQSDTKELESSIFRLNKELSTKDTKLHQLELENEKLKSQAKELEKTHKYNITFEGKLKQVVAENVTLTQRIMKLEETLRTARVTILHKEEELEELIKEYDAIKIQHQSMMKEAYKSMECTRNNGRQSKNPLAFNREILKSIATTVNLKCKQFKAELEFIKKCYKDELAIMLKYIESAYSDIATKCNCQSIQVKEECLKQIREVIRKADEDILNQTNMLKREFTNKLESLNKKCEVGEEKYIDLQQNLSDSLAKVETLSYQLKERESILLQKDRKIESCEAKLQQYEIELDSYFEENISELRKEFSKQNELDELEDQSKILKMKVITAKKIERLKNKIEEMQRAHYEEKLKVKEDYQNKIDNLFKESYTNIQRLSEADSEIEILKNANSALQLESQRLKSIIEKLLKETNIESFEDQNIENSLLNLISKFKERDRIIERIKQENNDK